MAGPGPQKKWCFFLTALVLAALLGLGSTAWALSGDERTSPEAIEKHIQELKVFYKDDHPEVQRYQRALEKAKEEEARRQTEQMKSQMKNKQPAAATPPPQEGESSH